MATTAIDEDVVRRWMAAYERAWASNQAADIEALFTEDARYSTEPYAAPWKGRDEIVSGWLAAKDEPGDSEFDYSILVAADEIGIVKGETLYKSAGRRYSNLWEVRLADSGECREFVEWWMERK